MPTLIAEIAATIDFPYEVLVQTEKGLSYAVMCGVERARGEYVAILDADGSHDVSVLPKMYELAKTCDVVVGSRYCHGGLNCDAFKRRVISRVFCKLAQFFLQLPIKDCMSGYTVARRSVFIHYPIESHGFKYLLELLTHQHGELRFAEYPIVFVQRKLGKSKADLKEGFRILSFIVQVWLGFKGKSFKEKASLNTNASKR